MTYALISITGEQIRAARALARTEQAELAKRSALSLQTIKRLEGIRGFVDANVSTLKAIVTAFEEMGIRFQDHSAGGGISMAPPIIRTNSSIYSANRGGEILNEPRDLFRLIYYSKIADVSSSSSHDVFKHIKAISAVRNEKLSVGGTLLLHEGRFLQCLEGPVDSVKEIYGAISMDPLHHSLKIIERGAIGARHFPVWRACTDIILSKGSAFAREPALVNGFKPEILTPDGAMRILNIASEMASSG